MLIGSHNALSYSKPKKWWLLPFRFMARCQKASIEEQYEKYDVRLFDIRINARKDDVIETAHGFMVFSKDTLSALNYINDKGDCYVRVLLEQNFKKKNQEIYDKKFAEKCKYIEEKFQNIKFCNGMRKYDGKLLYQFKYSEPSMVELYSSVTSLFKSKNRFLAMLDDLFPWLYAKLRNKKNYREAIEKGECEYLLMDFVNIK